jgi:hypothetical protein
MPLMIPPTNSAAIKASSPTTQTPTTNTPNIRTSPVQIPG